MMNKGVFLMTYAEAIKKLRSKMILTQMEFAQFLGVSFASINRWETGRFEPTMKIKRKLAPLFKEHGIEVEELWLRKLPRKQLIRTFPISYTI